MAKKKYVVKKIQGTLILILLMVLVISWIFTVRILSDNSDETEQMALVQSADTLLEDKLYVRAASRYKSAITDYTTDNNPELEVKLLSIYKEGGLEEEYYDLIKERIEEDKAHPEEYIDYADSLIQRGSTATAVSVLAVGEEKFDDESLTEMYESIKYEYSAREINFSEMKIPSSDWLIPIFNGEKWGYINSSGATVLDFSYEDTTRFSGNYAVVKIDGTYTLIDKEGNWIAIDKIGFDKVTEISEDKIIGVKDSLYYIYSYTFETLSNEAYEGAYLNDNGLVVVKKDGKWAVLSSELEPVTDFVYDEIAVNSVGQVFSGNFAVVKDKEGYFLINIKGTACFEIRFADAKGFNGGLIAVSEDGEKWGFINSRGEFIVEPQYDDAYSFSYNLAAVKKAGKWGYINRYNTMIIENDYETVTSFIEGKSLVKDSTGNVKVVSLKYYELFK